MASNKQVVITKVAGQPAQVEVRRGSFSTVPKPVKLPSGRRMPNSKR